jgi:RNA polymerase sigma factor (sigma-70 family)
VVPTRLGNGLRLSGVTASRGAVRARNHGHGPSADLLMIELAALHEREFPRLSRVAAAITGDIESARDVVQDAFANLVRHRYDHRSDASLTGWAWRAVVNTARSHLRAERSSLQALENAADRDRLDALASPAPGDADRAVELIRQLPERQRTIVFLRYYADLDYASIGEALSIKVGTVSAALNAARATIRAGLPS